MEEAISNFTYGDKEGFLSMQGKLLLLLLLPAWQFCSPKSFRVRFEGQALDSNSLFKKQNKTKQEYLEGNYFPKVPHTVLVIGSPEKVAFVVSTDKDKQNNHLQN